MKNSQQYQNSDFCQDYQNYGNEGYYPAYIGEKINPRYVIIQKLGYGHFSTVWLIQHITTKQYFAMKIQRNKQTYIEAAIEQMEFLKILNSQKENPEWIKFLQNKTKDTKLQMQKLREIYSPIHLYDHFQKAGFIGSCTHHCSVLELLGPNLLHIIQHFEFKKIKMPLKLVKSITRDLLFGLVYIHKFCKMIHTDLKPQNIVMKLNQATKLKCVEGLITYKRKPISMKYLESLKSNKSNVEPIQGQGLIHYKNGNHKVHKQNIYSGMAIRNIPPWITHPNGKRKQKNSYKNNKLCPALSFLFFCNQSTPQGTYTELQDMRKKKNKQDLNLRKQKKTIIQQVQKKSYLEKSTNYSRQEIEYLEWKQNKINLFTQQFSFKITDFGNATLSENHNSQYIQTRQYRAPEIILGHPYQCNTDIWSLGCIIFQMLTNNFIFKPSSQNNKPIHQDHLFRMMEVLGPMNKKFLSTGKKSKKFVNKYNELNNGNPTKFFQLNEILQKDFEYTQEQSIQINNFLKPIFQYQPEKRISAQECLNSKWLWN